MDTGRGRWQAAAMFLDTSDPRPPPPSPGPRRGKAKRDEDVLISLIVIALVAMVLAPFCGGTLWAAMAQLLG